MAVDSLVILSITAMFLLAATTMVCGYEGAVLTLKRTIPPSHQLDLSQLRDFDSARHGRLLQSPVRGAFNFPVERDANRLLSA